ncbi:DUF2125 domain-containing protein [Loktanella sp. 3ANDIMAR09]|uniref:DUF2125 domain-containing protein n=1 Tax=Loktanella sp. 3ANDIMAR09 TaxID=1225657 RepID=UPI0006FEEBAE|nr:DUF2125 domain-containing protein [Loktanella sp. 3ANDIMAR09]
MTRTQNLAPVLASALCLAGLPAFADVTPRQVWDNWQAIIDRSGSGAVTVGNLDEGADTLTATDVVYTFAGSDTTSAVMVDRITLQDNGDGTVSVSLPDDIPVNVRTDEGERIELYVAPSGAQTLVSGTPDAMNYAVSADQYVVGLTQMVDADGVPVDLDFRVALNSLTGNTVQNAGTDLNITYDFAAQSVDLLVDGADDTGEAFTMSGKIDEMALDADLTLPAGADLSDISADDLSGVLVSGGYGYESAAYIFASSGAEMSADGTATTGAVRVDFGIDADSLRYAVRADDMVTALRGTELPTAVEVAAASYEVGLTMPVSPSDEPQPFALNFGLNGVTLNDETWGLFDPMGAVPRDPADLVIDLSGTMLSADSDDTGADEMMENPLAGRTLASLDVNEIRLGAAGALIRAVGAFTYDLNGEQTLSDVTTPEGSATITLTGINQLIDTLIAMGVVPQDQAMMGRMMLGMFTTPAGDDTLETVFSFTNDGQITANGQRIR